MFICFSVLCWFLIVICFYDINSFIYFFSRLSFSFILISLFSSFPLNFELFVSARMCVIDSDSFIWYLFAFLSHTAFCLNFYYFVEYFFVLFFVFLSIDNTSCIYIYTYIKALCWCNEKGKRKSERSSNHLCVVLLLVDYTIGEDGWPRLAWLQNVSCSPITRRIRKPNQAQVKATTKKYNN